LNDRVIKTALSKKTELGVIEGELRGKHGNQPTIDPQIKQSVLDFINTIPRIESHYLRAHTTREFISSDKCLADLYRDYKSTRENNGLPLPRCQHLTGYSILISIFHFSFQKKISATSVNVIKMRTMKKNENYPRTMNSTSKKKLWQG